MLKLRHSLGCFSTLVPWAERAPLQPLTIQQPGPASWYSGLCPCLPGTVSFLLLSAAFFPHTPSAQGSLKAMHEMLLMIRKLQRISSTGSYEPWCCQLSWSSCYWFNGEQNHSLALWLALVKRFSHLCSTCCPPRQIMAITSQHAAFLNLKRSSTFYTAVMLNDNIICASNQLKRKNYLTSAFKIKIK